MNSYPQSLFTLALFTQYFPWVLAATEAREIAQIPGPNTKLRTHKVHSNLRSINSTY